LEQTSLKLALDEYFNIEGFVIASSNLFYRFYGLSWIWNSRSP